MTKLTTYILLLISIVACGHKNGQNDSTRKNQAITDSLTLQIQKINSQEKIVGFSVAVVDTTGILYNNGFGFSDKKSKKEYNTKTIQYVASISKTLIGISLLKAQEFGKLNLDEPINKYLPFEVINPNFPETGITIRQLAIHTSSITDSDIFWENNYILEQKEHHKGTAIPKYFNDPKSKLSINEFMKELLSKDGKLNNGESYSKNEPNQKFNYSNIGATLCAVVIENATGIPYEEFTTKYILEPLKMNSSGWSTENVNRNNFSTLYATNEQIMADYTTIDFPSSGLITSSNDLGKLLIEIINGYSGKGKILNNESYKELFRKQLTANQLPKGVNANVGIFIDYSKRGIGFNGYDAGLMAYMYFNPDNLKGKIVTINTDTDFDEAVRPTLDKIWELLGEYETKIN